MDGKGRRAEDEKRNALLFHCGFFFAAFAALRLLSFTCFLRLARSFVDRRLLVSVVHTIEHIRGECPGGKG
jgi:hypothetical protein